LVARYDKRYLSDTELRWLYTPGSRPVTFDVDGYRFGCALCIEQVFPDIFIEYAQLGVDCVLMASGADDLHLRAHASQHGYWIALAERAEPAEEAAAPSGIIGPTGTWMTTVDPGAVVAVGEIDRDDPKWQSALFGRAWRSTARRQEIYRGLRRDDDPRSINQEEF
jgi:predicted amidohydrolase